jgi:hypothetical protein
VKFSFPNFIVFTLAVSALAAYFQVDSAQAHFILPMHHLPAIF